MLVYVVIPLVLILLVAVVAPFAGRGPGRATPGHLQLVLPQAPERPVEATITVTGGVELAPTVVDDLLQWPPLGGAGPRPWLRDPDGVLIARIGYAFLEVSPGHGGTYDVSDLPWQLHDGRPTVARGHWTPGYAVDSRVRLYSRR